MSNKVFYGSPRQARLEAKETLPAKLDLILEQLHLRERVKDETVVIKMHTGNNIVYSTIHPVFVRKVVEAIKEGGASHSSRMCFGTSMELRSAAITMMWSVAMYITQPVWMRNTFTAITVHTRISRIGKWLGRLRMRASW